MDWRETTIVHVDGAPPIPASTNGTSTFPDMPYEQYEKASVIELEMNTITRTRYLRYFGLTVSERGEVTCLLYEQKLSELYLLAKEDKSEQSETNCQQKCRNWLLCGQISKSDRISVTHVINKETMRKARDSGWSFLKFGIFPLVSAYWREVWIYVQLVIALVIFLYHVISFAVDDDGRIPLDIAALVFSTISSVLTITDLLINIYTQRCRTCRDCVACVRRGDWSSCLSEVAASRNVAGSNPFRGMQDRQQEENAGDASCANRCCKLCFVNDYSDLFRTLLSELFIYPIVICSMFRFIIGLQTKVTGRYHTVKLVLNVVFFALPVIWNVVTVYVLRLVVLAFIMKTVQRVKKDGGPGTVSGTGMWFHIRFFFHVLGQMVSQALMIACVGWTFYLTNMEAKDAGSFIVVSFLWYPMIGAFLIPLLGIFTFALTNYYEFEEYPIAYLLVIFGYLRKQKVIVQKKKNREDMEKKKNREHMEKKENREDMEKKENREDMERVVQEVLDAGFNEIHQRSYLEKSFYCFLSPTILFLCVLYGTMVNLFFYFSVGIIFIPYFLFLVPVALIYWANLRIIIVTAYVYLVLSGAGISILILITFSPLIGCVYYVCKPANNHH